MKANAEQVHKVASGALGIERLQFATFYLAQEYFGLNILQVQEIQQPQSVTPVPRAPRHVLGLISLRGQIIPLLDLRRLLGISGERTTKNPYHIVVQSAGVVASLEVDRIGDVIDVSKEQYKAPPESVRSVDREYLRAVYPMENGLLSVLDVDKLLAVKFE